MRSLALAVLGVLAVPSHAALAAPHIAGLAAALLAGHIELDVPKVRYANDAGEVNNNCPCGAGSGGQTCSGGITSDPNRDEGRATTLAPGAHITVRWRETVGHAGRFRVAFDNDGADLADFNANILADNADPDDGTGDRSATVTLPATECDRCTLQLIQDMSGDTADAVLDPTGDRTYFQCADMVLKKGAPASLDDGSGGCSAGGAAGAPTGLVAVVVAAGVRARRRTARPDHRN